MSKSEKRWPRVKNDAVQEWKMMTKILTRGGGWLTSPRWWSESIIRWSSDELVCIDSLLSLLHLLTVTNTILLPILYIWRVISKMTADLRNMMWCLHYANGSSTGFFWGFGPTSRQAVVVIKSQAHAMQNICKYSKAHAMQNICKYSKAYIHQVNSPAHLNVGDVRHSVAPTSKTYAIQPVAHHYRL